jgi:hypothetical protein
MSLVKIDVDSPEYLSLRIEYSELTRKYQSSGESKFIGGMPVTLERDCLRPLLRKNNGEYAYYVTLKVDGERYLLFINKESLVYFVSRSLNFYYLPSFSNGNVANCLFDGEMVFFQNGESEFLIFDALFYKGESLIEMNYPARMKNVQNVQNVQNFTITVKKWFNLGEVLGWNNCYSQIEKTTNQSRKNKLMSDGLILQPFDTNYVTGPWIKNKNIQFKWKPVEQQTIDFKIKVINTNTWHLLTKNGNPFMINQKQGNPLPATCIPDKNNKRVLNDGDVAEFKLVDNNIFKVYKLRDNKEANSIPSALSVMNFLNNPFTLDILKTENGLTLLTKSQLILCICKVYNTFFTKSDQEILKNNYELIKDKNTEFELRFYKSGSQFGGGVKRYVFENINNYLISEKYPYGIIQSFDILSNNSRSEYSINGQLMQNITKTKYDIYSENKETIQKIIGYSKSFNVPVDMDELRKLKKKPEEQKDYSETYYRFGLSTERKSQIVVPEIVNGRSNLVRIKNRVSYYSSLFRIDLTVVKEGYGFRQANGSMDKYEIELEYIGNKLNEGTIPFEDFLNSLNSLTIKILIAANNC